MNLHSSIQLAKTIILKNTIPSTQQMIHWHIAIDSLRCLSSRSMFSTLLTHTQTTPLTTPTIRTHNTMTTTTTPPPTVITTIIVTTIQRLRK